jgi:DNA-binding response OmpR family regulator
MRGLELVQHLRAARYTTPVLMISFDASLSEQALAVGADTVLAKPFDLTELMAALSSLLPPERNT